MEIKRITVSYDTKWDAGMIVAEQYSYLDYIFKYYNDELFGGILKECMFTMCRKKNMLGFFSNERWKKNGSEKGTEIHEIGLNPDYLCRKGEECHATLVHEMAHLWQEDFGKPPRRCYHDKQWGEKMKSIGLFPSNTGLAGGKETGQKVSHYIVPDGKFIRSFNKLFDKNIKYVTKEKEIISNNKAGKSQGSKHNHSKTKYTCSCGNNVWGKPGLVIICAGCAERYSQCE